MEEKIIISFPKRGGVKVEVQGMQGPGCLEWTRPLEEAFGGRVEERETKPEFYEEVPQEEQLRQQN